MKWVMWFALILGSGLGAQGQKIQIPASWDKLAAKADEVDNVTLDKSMLGLAAKFVKDDNDQDTVQVEKLLGKLNGIYVRHLEFKNPGEFTEADVEPVRAQLQGPEWSHIVEVNDKSSKEKVIIYVRTSNGKPAGMVILAEEPTELTFVHLDGEIDPQDLDALSGNFGIPKDIHAAPKGNLDQSKDAVGAKP
ncbi:MAG TPA: DUF4252 domain-containing protein [Terriglobales bacterium]